MAMVDAWTDDRIDIVKQNYAHRSATEISELLWASGATLSRSAVLGKASRLGLIGTKIIKPVRPKQRRPMERRQRLARKPKTTSPFGSIWGGGTGTPKPPTLKFDPDVIPDGARLVSLMQLTSKHCRFPIGDPGEQGFAFCGCDPLPERPYCATHTAIAYQPKQGRQNV